LTHQPMYKQVSKALEETILERYECGEYLPSEKELALQFRVNRHTVRRAVDELISAGMIMRKQGKGSQVINNQIEYSLNAGRFTATLDKLRRKSSSEVLKADIINCPSDIAEIFSLNIHDSVIVIDTLRFVDDAPMSLITHYLNPSHTPAANHHYSGGSLHEFIEAHYGISLLRTSVLLAATMPTQDEAKALRYSLNQPLLQVKSFNGISTDPKSIVEVSVSRSRADRFQIKIPGEIGEDNDG